MATTSILSTRSRQSSTCSRLKTAFTNVPCTFISSVASSEVGTSAPKAAIPLEVGCCDGDVASS